MKFLLNSMMLSVALVFCWNSVGTAEDYWAAHDDIVIVHYPSAMTGSDALKGVSQTQEWKEFIKKSVKKLDEQYSKSISKSELSSTIDAWVREQLGKLNDDDGVSFKDITRDYFGHAKAFALGLNVDFSKPRDERVNGTVTCILDFDSAEIDDVKDIIKKEFVSEQVLNEKGVVVLKVKVKDGDVFIGKANMGESDKSAVVIGRSQKDVVDKTKEFAKASQLAKQVNDNKTVLKAVYVNTCFFDKITPPQLDKIVAKGKSLNDARKSMTGSISDKAGWKKMIPGTPCDFLKSVCQKVDSLIYTVEQSDPNKVVVSLGVNTVSEQDAQEINDVIVGMVAFMKIQARDKDKKADVKKVEGKKEEVKKEEAKKPASGEKAKKDKPEKADAKKANVKKEDAKKEEIKDDIKDEVKKVGTKVQDKLTEDKAVEVLQMIKFSQNGRTITAKVELSNQTVRNYIKRGLKKAADQIINNSL